MTFRLESIEIVDMFMVEFISGPDISGFPVVEDDDEVDSWG